MLRATCSSGAVPSRMVTWPKSEAARMTVRNSALGDTSSHRCSADRVATALHVPPMPQRAWPEALDLRARHTAREAVYNSPSGSFERPTLCGIAPHWVKRTRNCSNAGPASTRSMINSVIPDRRPPQPRSRPGILLRSVQPGPAYWLAEHAPAELRGLWTRLLLRSHLRRRSVS